MTKEQQIQVGAKGITITARITDELGNPVPLDGTPVFHFQSPDGTDYALDGVIADADDGVAAYVLEDGDNVGEVAGIWQYQVALDLASGWSGATTIRRFEAVANLY